MLEEPVVAVASELTQLSSGESKLGECLQAGQTRLVAVAGAEASCCCYSQQVIEAEYQRLEASLVGQGEAPRWVEE